MGDLRNKKNEPDKGSISNNNGKKYKLHVLLAIEALVVIIIVVAYLFFTNYLKNKNAESNEAPGTKTEQTKDNNNKGNDSNSGGKGVGEDKNIVASPTPDAEKELENKIDALLNDADNLAKGYDYEAAIKLVTSFDGDYTNYDKLTKAVDGYKAQQANLVPFGAYDSINEISHIFFHTLVVNNKLAFDGDYESNGYNYYMTTIPEFKEMMQQMYDAGYVVVSIHDVAKKVKNADGTVTYAPGDIMLPPDKKPFVISQDDVNYYEYMKKDGFATRIVIDENGDPKNEMKEEDGTISVGDYDMVPILDTFIKEHPDFSYKGARGIIALTGYEGTLGYRTNELDSPTYEADKKAVTNVVKVMKEKGWEFASHSYGHRDMGKATYKFTVKDTDRWMKEVGSIIGPTDIYIFPFGIDIETTVGHYASDKFKYLKGLGFDYFCGVFKDPWIQVQKDYVRMTRRPLDGQAMLQFPERLKDLFDLKKVIDPDRPALK